MVEHLNVECVMYRIGGDGLAFDDSREVLDMVEVATVLDALPVRLVEQERRAGDTLELAYCGAKTPGISKLG
jgi:hypothetical protein